MKSTRASASLAGLAVFVLSSPLLAAPLGNTGYTTSQGGYGGGTHAGCASCAAPVAPSNCHGPKVDCPPPYCHVYEGPPHLKFKRGCPRPVCDPCELPHFGYYQTCWSPWPYPPDWRHCPYPTASDMLPPPPVAPYTPKHNAERFPESDPDSRREPAPRRKPKVDDDEGSDVLPKPQRKFEPLPPPGKIEKESKEQGKNIHSSYPSIRLTTR